MKNGLNPHRKLTIISLNRLKFFIVINITENV